MVNFVFLLAFGLTLLPAEDVSFDRMIRSEKFLEVLPSLETYVKAHPESSDAAYQLGYVYFRLRRMQDAVRSLSASLARNPNNADAHRVLGFALTALGRSDLAHREFLRALESKPDSVEMLYALGRLRFERGSYSDAAETLTRVIQLDPAHWKAHETLGLAYEALNQITQAGFHLTTAVEINEKATNRSELPYASLAGFYNRRGDYSAALLYANRGATIAPKSDAAHFQAAKAHCGAGQWRECAGEVQQAIEIDRENPDFYYLLSTAQRRLGSADQAQASLEEFRRLKKWESTGGSSTRIAR
jgi:tetratricopeptide (TPR) repeat protein